MDGLDADIYHPVSHFECNLREYALLQALYEGELHKLKDARDHHSEKDQDRQHNQRLYKDSSSNDVDQRLRRERNGKRSQSSHHCVGDQDYHVTPLLPH